MTVAKHDGPDLTAEDQARLTRQLDDVRRVMLTYGGWWTLHDLSAETGATETSVSARLRDLRKLKYGGWTVERRRVSGLGIYEYHLVSQTEEKG